MSNVVGIDLGSRTTKIVQILDGNAAFTEIFDTGRDPLPRVGEILNRLSPERMVATGYGRHLIRENFGAAHVTEIRACARGAYHYFPGCRTVLDVGGQDCKLALLDEKGRVLDFELNDRCAAGTGKFLEVMAQTFEMPLPEFIRIALQANEPVPISSMCTVFAESEVISLITSGRPKEQIALGLHVAITNRLMSMMGRFPVEDGIIFVGGGARNDCLQHLLEKGVGCRVDRPENPQLVIALGAALIAEDE
ncbi:3-hydroxyacyl-ACP dehydratase [Candidatus Sumerlaeota bacterium]|nr:3-hydroxyacyl-ACP dehydratase [Candidatus Sumerlaeota bacterium]